MSSMADPGGFSLLFLLILRIGCWLLFGTSLGLAVIFSLVLLWDYLLMSFQWKIANSVGEEGGCDLFCVAVSFWFLKGRFLELNVDGFLPFSSPHISVFHCGLLGFIFLCIRVSPL